MTTPPGLQAERTRLAWRRTTLAGAALVVLALTRTLIGGGQRLDIVATSGLALLWLATLAVAHRRLRALAATPTDPRTVARAPATLALLVVASTVAAALLVR